MSMGVDPGSLGAAVFKDTVIHHIYSFSGKERPRIARDLHALIQKWNVKKAYIEDVWSVESSFMRVKQIAGFSKNIQMVHTVCDVNNVEIVSVLPKAWQKHFGGVNKKVEGGEEKIKQMAAVLAPAVKIKRIDEAEAILILEAGIALEKNEHTKPI